MAPLKKACKEQKAHFRGPSSIKSSRDMLSLSTFSTSPPRTSLPSHSCQGNEVFRSRPSSSPLPSSLASSPSPSAPSAPSASASPSPSGYKRHKGSRPRSLWAFFLDSFLQSVLVLGLHGLIFLVFGFPDLCLAALCLSSERCTDACLQRHVFSLNFVGLLGVHQQFKQPLHFVRFLQVQLRQRHPEAS